MMTDRHRQPSRGVRRPDDGTGHLEELRADPIGLLHRVRDECGDIGRFRLADRTSCWSSGAEANEEFFRAPDDDARPGRGVPVHDADLRQGRRLRRLARGAPADAEEPGAARRHDARPRRDHRGARSAGWSPSWGDEGEIDLLDWFAELTIYTTSACLIGTPFREELDASFAAALPRPRARHRRASPTSTPTPTSRASAAATRPASQLVELVQAIIDRRRARGTRRRREERDLLDVLMSHATMAARSTPTVTGIFISMMFAGHHTTLGHRGLDADRAAAPPRA